MLLRYARTQFVDPNKDCDDWEKEVTNFYDDDEEVMTFIFLGHILSWLGMK